MRKNVKTVIVLTVVIIFITNCESKSAQPSASAVADAWLEIKTKINPLSMTKTELSAEIKEFNRSLNSFLNSPIGYLYRTHRRGEMRSIQDINAVINSLEAAIQKGSEQEALSCILEIDKAVSILQHVDTELSNTSQLNYFLLFFFFSLLIIAITLTLTVLRKRLEKEMLQHQQSLSFSREIILAQEQERSRIARELHDTVAQDLLRLSLQTKIIKKGSLSEEQNRLCAEVAGGQTELLNRIRNICDNLIPPDFQPSGINHSRLSDALRNLCHAFEKRTGIECKITIQDNVNFDFLDIDKQLHCFRIVQECLANIEKHANADEVSVVVRSNADGELLLFVTDNGKGFLAPKKDFYTELRAKGHFGLWNMHERAASLNGVLTFDSEADEGTTIKLIIPPPPQFFRRGGVNYDFHSPHRRSPHTYQRYKRMAEGYRTLYNRRNCRKSCPSPQTNVRARPPASNSHS